jgi:outer membrane lipoprotein-sorting protein
MKRIFVLFFAFAFITAHAQTVDEIVQKYANAVGGLDNFKKIKTAKFSGTASAQGNEFPLTVQIINGRAMRTDVEVMGQTITNAYKDGKGWKINPYAGAPTATDATADELYEFKIQGSLTSQLMDYKDRGYKAELLGQEDVQGAKTYKIKLTTDDNKTTTYFVDANTYALVKTIGMRSLMGQEMELETYYSEVKDIGNVKFSMMRSVQSGGQTIQEVHFDKIELDVPIDEKIFDKQ